MANIERRKGIDGTDRFRVKVRLRGHPAVSASFRRLTDARKWVQATEAAIREGRYFKTAEAKRHTLADLIDRYSLTGLTTEQCLFFLYGSGANGKSTFLNLVRELLGADFAQQTPSETLMARRSTATNDPQLLCCDAF